MDRSSSGEYLTNQDIANHFGDFLHFLPLGIVTSGNFDSETGSNTPEPSYGDHPIYEGRSIISFSSKFIFGNKNNNVLSSAFERPGAWSRFRI